MIKRIATFALMYGLSAGLSAQIKPVWGIDGSLLTSVRWIAASDWELFALYPSLGIWLPQADWGNWSARLSAFAGGGLSLSFNDLFESPSEGSPSIKSYWTSAVGGYIDLFFDSEMGISLGGGIVAPNLVGEIGNWFPFIRAAVDYGFPFVSLKFASLKLYFDFNFGSSYYKLGLLASVYVPFGGKPAPKPTPQPAPAPVPSPPPQPAPKPKPALEFHPVPPLPKPENPIQQRVRIYPTLVDPGREIYMERDWITGPSHTALLQKDAVLDLIALNQDNKNFQNLLFLTALVSDLWTYNLDDTGCPWDPRKPRFVCVDYVAYLIHLINQYLPELENYTLARVDNDHIWMYFAIPCKVRENGKVVNKSGLWVDPTWFDNEPTYNFNYFCPSEITELPKAWSLAPLDCHTKNPAWLTKISELKEVLKVDGIEYVVCPGFQWSVVYNRSTKRYEALEYDFGRNERWNQR